MAQLETWVNDKLHDILGISDKYIGQYLIGLATKSTSTDGYISSLKETGAIDVNDSVISFARELWDKVKL